MPKVAKTWQGLNLIERVERAAGRAIVGIGVEVAKETKRVTHVREGTLRRSVHVAAPTDHHFDDEREAAGRDMLETSFNVKPDHSPEGPVVEVGSWLEYACVEWIGRGHPGVTQGLEVTRGARTDAIVAQAFTEEGLR